MSFELGRQWPSSARRYRLATLAITPIVIIPFARVLEAERPSPRSLLGVAIAVAGVIALALAR